MSENQRAPIAGLCTIIGGSLTTRQVVTPSDPSIERARETWAAGDFGRIAAGYASGAAAFVERLDLAPGEAVLDVASGTGNLSIPAARRGARVTGIDIAPNLVDSARAASAAASVDIRFDVGAAEALPYADGSFDTVISMFGVMFSACPELALAELVRVTRHGGRIVLANWTVDGFVASMLRAHSARVPPPPGAPSPLMWGDEVTMRRLLEAQSAVIRGVELMPRPIHFTFALTPGGVVELFRECYGPSVRAFRALDAEGRASLGSELYWLWEAGNHAPAGSTSVAAEYLQVRIDIA